MPRPKGGAPIVAVCIIALVCISTSFNWTGVWPDDIRVISEFADVSGGQRIPYISFASEEFQAPSDEGLIFEGNALGGLGPLRIYNAGRGFYQSTGQIGNEAQALLVMDISQRRILNPEMLFESPAGRRSPELIAVILEHSEQGSETALLINGQRQNRGNQGVSVEEGLYRLRIASRDSRFGQEDFRRVGFGRGNFGQRNFEQSNFGGASPSQGAFSTKVFVNEGMLYWQGDAYFQEVDSQLILFPGEGSTGGGGNGLGRSSGEAESSPSTAGERASETEPGSPSSGAGMQISIPLGETTLGVEIHDPTGLSAYYEFSIEGIESNVQVEEE